jgi:predicted nucleotidyltransferase
MIYRPMKREQALSLLREHHEDMQRRFGIKHLTMFGSTAQDDAREDSGVAVLVDFETTPTFDGYMGLLSYLEQLFGKKVDLATGSGLKPRARLEVEKDLLRAA